MFEGRVANSLKQEHENVQMFIEGRVANSLKQGLGIFDTFDSLSNNNNLPVVEEMSFNLFLCIQ